MRVSVLLLSLAVVLPAVAEVKVWTNSNGGSWNAPANWSPNGAPSTNDMAVITNNGAYTVTLDMSPTIAGLTLGGGTGTQTLATAWQTLALNGPGQVAPSGQLVLSGALSGTNHLLVQGSISWLGGTVDAYSTIEVGTSGSLVVGGGANHGRILVGSLINAGTIIYEPPGALGLAGPVHNLAGGLFDIRWDNNLFDSSPSGVFLNDGTLRKSAGGGAAVCEVPLINKGTLDTQTGTLVLSDGSVFNDGSRFIGAGITRLESGTNILNGAIYSDNLLLQGATLTGSGSLNGTVTWGAGYIGYGAAVLLATNSQLFIGGGANYSRILLGSLTNAGTIIYDAPGPLGLAGPLHNLAGAVFDIRWNQNIFKSGSAGVFINDGTLRKSVGLSGAGCEVPLINNGTVDTQTGILALGDGSVFNEGSRFIGAGITRLESGTNTLNSAIYSDNLLLQGATLTGSGSLNGTVTWGAGYIGYGAAVLLATNSQLFIGGGANHSRILLGSLTNAGTIIYEAPGPLVLAGPVHNLAGALFDIRWNQNIFKSGSAGVFINDGTLRKSASLSLAGCEVPLINNGTVDTQTGILVLGDGSVFNEGSRFIGAGITRLESGTNTLNGAVYSDNLLLQGTSLTGTGSFSGTVTWGAGYIGYGAAVLIATNGQLIIGGGANYARILLGSLTNAGTIVYEPPGPLGLAGPLHNLAGGLFEIHWDYNLFNSGPQGMFINDGTFRKSAGAATAECQVPFVNRGTVDIPSGRLYFSGAYAQPSGDLLLRSGKLRYDPPLNLAGGRLLGWGTVEANLINDGATVSPYSSNGVITLSGNYTQRIGGSIEFTLGGLNPGTNLSHLKVTGSAQLNGTLVVRLQQPYLPEPGDAHPVMSFASRQGDFARRNGLILLGHDRRLVTSYGPKTFSLLTIAQPDPAGVLLQIGIEGNAALVSWPLEFGAGTLYACTNLVQPEWIVIPTPENWFLDQPMVPQKFFRLTIP